MLHAACEGVITRGVERQHTSIEGGINLHVRKTIQQYSTSTSRGSFTAKHSLVPSWPVSPNYNRIKKSNADIHQLPYTTNLCTCSNINYLAYMQAFGTPSHTLTSSMFSEPLSLSFTWADAEWIRLGQLQSFLRAPMHTKCGEKLEVRLRQACTRPDRSRCW